MASLGISDYALIALAFFYSLNMGPMIFETFTSDRTWGSAPPDSFHMFRGPFGHKTAHYWKVVTPLAAASFLIGLALNWSVVGRRLCLLAFLLAFLAVQIPTIAFFVPEQEQLTSDVVGLSQAQLTARAQRWLSLAYLRNLVGVIGFVCLMLALPAPQSD